MTSHIDDDVLDESLMEYIVRSEIPGTNYIYKHKKDHFNYGYLELSNKLKVVFIEDPDAKMSGAHMCVGTGIVCDPKDAQGISHFLEHMLFMGSDEYPEVDTFMNMVNISGGMTNAYTTERDTQYYFSTSSNSLLKILHCFSCFFRTARFDQHYVEKEVSAVESEHMKNIGNDGWRKNHLYKKFLDDTDNQGVHTNFGTGTRETLIGLKSKETLRMQLIEYFETHYCADLMTLVVYHNMVDREFIRQICDWFSKVPLRDSSKTKEIMNKPGNFVPNNIQGIETICMKTITKSNDLELGWNIRTNSKYQSNTVRNPISLLSHVLGSEGYGTLDALLKSKNSIYSLFAGSSNNYGKNISFSINLELPECDMDSIKETINIVINYIRNLKKVYSDNTLFDELFDEQDNLRNVLFRNFHQISGLEIMQPIIDLIANKELDPKFCMVSPALKRERNEIYKNFMYCLDEMDIDRLKIMVLNDQITDTNEREPHYGTEYLKSIILNKDIVRMDITDYPQKNPFIVDKHEVYDSNPKNINETDNLNSLCQNSLCQRYHLIRTMYPQTRIYIEKGNKYGLMNELIYITISRKEQLADPLLEIMFFIYNMYMNRRLNKDLQTMNYAGYTVNCVFGINTTILSFDGYCDRMVDIIKNIMTQYISINDIDIKLYEIVYSEVKKILENNRMIEPYRQLSQLFSENGYGEYYCSNESLLKEIEKLSPINIQNRRNEINITNFIEKCRENIFIGTIKGVMAGGITEDRAIIITQIIEELFIQNIDHHFPKQFEVITSDRIKENYNKHDPNNGILYSFYLGTINMTNASAYNSNKWAKLSVISNILCTIVAEKFSLYMRTKGETGYIATAQLNNVSINHISDVYLSFMIQTELDRTQIFEKMKHYIELDLMKDIINITDDEFNEYKLALLSELTEPLKNIYDEVRQIKTSLNSKYYKNEDIELFDKRKRLVDALNDLIKDTFIKKSIKWLYCHPNHAIMIANKNT